ncbi:MAG TPA: hypothetical protein GXX51_05780 [Firmicutes bacterium]|nr:hypothetical protein [Bacillota bacterium]
MLIIYKIDDGSIVSISGFGKGSVITPELVDAIKLVDPLPEGQAEYRIYDPMLMDKIWEANDRGAVLTVALDGNGNPIGVMADGTMIV